METRIENNTLVIRIPLNPKASSTGKMLLVASTGGWTQTNTEYQNQALKINLTAGIDLVGRQAGAGRFNPVAHS